MNCPFCKKLITGMTGLQELQKFQKHLNTCRKNPKRQIVISGDGDIRTTVKPTDLREALNIRHESGQ